jgi:SEFIR domain-containing protein
MSAVPEGTAAGVARSQVVFISYSHDSDAHKEKVLRLAERLRQDGLDAQLDRYVNGTPEQGWPRWMLDRLDEAGYVLVVCTETYYRRFRGHEAPGRGKGADWEGALITQEIYDAKSRTVKFVPVLLAAGQKSFIPDPLRVHTDYEVTSEERYQALYRFLRGQGGVEPTPLGETRPILREAAEPLRFPESDPSSATERSRRRPHPLLWLASPTAALLLLVGFSTFWHLPTRVQLDLATTRLAVTLGGEQRREVFDRSVPFSSLLFEDCSSAVFAAEKLEVADPRQLVPGTEAGETPHFPAAAWRELTTAGLVKLSCQDPAAKLALQNPDPAAARLGTLDRIRFAPGSQLILEVSSGREPALSVEIETPQRLNLPLGRDLELVAEFVQPEGIAVPFSGDLLTWRARLPEARRMFEITSGERGLVLVMTLARGQAAELFRKKLDLPLTSVELLEEDLEGTPASPLRENAILSYPDLPAVPAVTIESDEAVGLGGLSKARLTRLSFDAAKGALRARFEGIAEQATSSAGAFTRDHRLTLFHAFRYSWRWGLLAVAAWLVSTILAASKAWKKVR